MTRRAGLLVAACLLPPLVMVIAGVSAQTVSNGGATAVTRDSLLKEAHSLASGLPAADRAEVMARIVDVAPPGSPTLESWINELFALGSQLGDVDRDGPEAAAAKAMSRIAPAKALKMLDSIQEPHLEPEQPYRDARAEAAGAVFTAAYAQFGAGLLPNLRGRAKRMGTTGQYPYLAWAQMSSLLQNSPAGRNFIRSTFDDAVSAYLASVANGAAEEDFRHLMAATWRLIPHDVAHSAAEKVVERLRAQAAEKHEGTRTLRMFTAKGEADFYNPGQLRLLRFVNEVVVPMDPEFANTLRNSEPPLNQSALQPEAGLDTFVPEVVPAGDTRSLPSAPVQRSEAMVRAEYLSHKDVNAAIAYAKGISDPLTRSEALTAIVTGPVLPGAIGQTSLNTDVARDVVAQAEQSAEGVADAPGRLLAFGHVAEAAASIKDNDVILRAADLGFPIGSQLLNDAKARGSMQREVVAFWLQHMMTYLARVDSQTALANAQSITDAKLRAFFLTEVAARWREEPGQNR
jgi:hypothetical protein